MDAFTPFTVLYLFKFELPSANAPLSFALPAYPVFNLYDPFIESPYGLIHGSTPYSLCDKYDITPHSMFFIKCVSIFID
ncbi:hypothetical protein D3C73_1329010 [compost metagenome]